MNCGPACLQMIAVAYGMSLPRHEAERMTQKTRNGVSLLSIVEAASSLGLQPEAFRGGIELLHDRKGLPFIAHWRANHFVVGIVEASGKIRIYDPASSFPVVLTQSDFERYWIEGGYGIAVFFDAEPTQRPTSRIEATRPIRELYSFLKPYQFQLILIFLLLTTTLALTIINPFIARNMVNGTNNNSPKDYIIFLTIAQILIFFCRALFEAVRNCLLHRVALQINLDMLTSFVRNLLRSSLPYVETKNIGDILVRFQDHERLRTFFGTYFLTSTFDCLVVISLCIVLVFYNPYVFGCLFAGTVLYLCWLLALLMPLHNRKYERANEVAKMRGLEFEFVTGFADIKISGSQRQVEDRWRSRQNRLALIEQKINSFQEIQRSGAFAIHWITLAIANGLEVYSVAMGSSTFGDLLAVSLILGISSGPITNLVNILQASQDAWISLHRIFTFEEGPPDGKFAAAEQIPTALAGSGIEVRNVTFGYSGSATVLKDVSLSAKRGSKTAIVGQSGSGKTTLLKILLHLYQPHQGSVTVHGRRLHGSDVQVWQTKCGTVLQDGFVFSDSLENNITMMFGHGPIEPDRLKMVIAAAGLSEFISALPRGLDTEIGDNGIGLSGGQKQRILIARALYARPDFLFMDEATSSLDTITEAKIVSNIASLLPEATQIIVAHRLSTVVNADQILVLDKGIIVERGNHQELVSRRGYYYELVSSQLELAR